LDVRLGNGGRNRYFCKFPVLREWRSAKAQETAQCDLLMSLEHRCTMVRFGQIDRAVPRAAPLAHVRSANRNRLLPISTSIVPKSGKPDFGGAPQF
jgi:hypothetical protein